MRIDIITVLPELLNGFLSTSIVGRARKKDIVDIYIHDLRAYGIGKHKKVDDYPYGGEAGMVMMIEPVDNCLSDLKNERNYDEIIYTSPDGTLFNQKCANRLSTLKNLVFICGHYKGVDERIREHLVTMELSIGNYVLSGGEIPAAAITDSIVRLLPGALGDGSSALNDSFQDGLVAPPVYTRPMEYNGWKVPDILRSGNEGAIDEWRFNKSLERTERKMCSINNDKEFVDRHSKDTS